MGYQTESWIGGFRAGPFVEFFITQCVEGGGDVGLCALLVDMNYQGENLG